MIEPILVEAPNPAHPYGATGVGEVNIVPPMAAIANAIDSAIRRRLTELPMSPPKVRAALEQATTRREHDVLAIEKDVVIASVAKQSRGQGTDLERDCCVALWAPRNDGHSVN